MSVTSGCGAIEGVTCSSGFATLRVHLDKSSAGRQWVHRSCESPQRAAVDVELHQFDRAVSGELTEHRKSCDEDTEAPPGCRSPGRVRSMGRSSKFDVGFQAHAVELARMSQRPRCQIASELGLSDTTLAKWMAKSEKDKAPESLGLGERAELDQLRAEKREWLLERELLEKAMAFWVKESRG